MSWATWVFSGIGIAIPIALISWFLSSKSSDQKTSTRQLIKSGNHSTNVQIVGNGKLDGISGGTGSDGE
jgi:hypothetical protein